MQSWTHIKVQNYILLNRDYNNRPCALVIIVILKTKHENIFNGTTKSAVFLSTEIVAYCTHSPHSKNIFLIKNQSQTQFLRYRVQTQNQHQSTQRKRKYFFCYFDNKRHQTNFVETQSMTEPLIYFIIKSVQKTKVVGIVKASSSVSKQNGQQQQPQQ